MGRIISVFLIGVFLVAVGFWLYSTGNISFASPVPRVFGASSDVEDFKSDWKPKESVDKKDYGLNISARSGIVVDYDTGEVIFAKNIHNQQPVASTVKIMTAILSLKKSAMSNVFTVSAKAAKVGENSMILTAGEKLTLRELLYGIMLVSGNDAAVTIAENVSGSEEKFVASMNDAAKKLGADDTKFVNASGLDDDNKSQYSSAYDMAIFGHYLWDSFPEIRDIASTYHYYIDASATHKDFELYNDTNLLTTYPGVKGIKPGFTWEAGLCLVTYAENNGKRLIAVVLGSDDRRGEMKELLDYGFAHYGIKVAHPGLDLQL